MLLQGLKINSKLVTLYTLKSILVTWGLKWESGFDIIKCLTPYSTVLKITINGKSRNANVADLHLTNTLDILETDNLPYSSWGVEQSSCLQKSPYQIQGGRSYISNEKVCTLMLYNIKIINN